MEIDLDKYIINKEPVVRWYFQNVTNYDDVAAIAIISVSYGVPCLCSAYWIGEANGWSQAVLDNISSITEFYGYKKVTGIPASYPFQPKLRDGTETLPSTDDQK